MKPVLHLWPVRVYWEDTDASGVVYHANYLRWFDRARTEWLRALGHDQDQLMRELRIAFTVAGMELKYRKPARLDDQLEVVTELVELKNVSLSFQQRLRRQGGGDDWLTEARVRLACVDTQSFAPKRIPALGL